MDVFPLLDKTKRYWLPFYNDGYCGKIWEQYGFDVIHQEEDFWETMYPETIVVDNPPYKVKGIVKVKEKIMERLCENNIPFCLLFPTTTIHTGYFKGLEEKYGKFQLIVPSRKIDFERSALTEKVSVKSEAQSRPEVGDIRNYFTPPKARPAEEKTEETRTKPSLFTNADLLSPAIKPKVKPADYSRLKITLPLDAYDYHAKNGEIENSSDEEELETKNKCDAMKSRCPFYTIWICWNMNFPNDMILV